MTVADSSSSFPMYASPPWQTSGRSCQGIPIEPEAPPGESYWLEEHLDHRPIVAAVNGLLPQREFGEFAASFGLVSSVVNQLAGVPTAATSVPGPRATALGVGTETQLELVRRTIDATTTASKYTVQVRSPRLALLEPADANRLPGLRFVHLARCEDLRFGQMRASRSGRPRRACPQ